MTLLDRPAIARLLGIGDDGPIRPDGRWMPENGRELYFHSHLTEPVADEQATSDDDRKALRILRQISRASAETGEIARIVEQNAATETPVDRYVVGDDGNVTHITATGEVRIQISPRG